MNDLDLQRALRQLAAPVPPARDLWPAIAARIGVLRARRRPRWPLLTAAAIVIAVIAASLPRPPAPAPQFTRVADARATLHLSRTRAPDDDPRLLAAAIVLDSAQAQLEQALAQQPGNPSLEQLLKRTQQRRIRLDQFGASAG